MSQTLAAATSRHSTAPVPQDGLPRQARGAARPPRPALRVVQAPRTDRGRTVLAVTCVGLLTAGLLALLLINTALAQGSYVAHDLQTTSQRLADREQALNEDLASQAAPARLAERAISLGMVPSDSAVFLRLPDGRVLGVAKAAGKAADPSLNATAATHGTAAAARARAKADKATKKAKRTVRGAGDAGTPTTTATQTR